MREGERGKRRRRRRREGWREGEKDFDMCTIIKRLRYSRHTTIKFISM